MICPPCRNGLHTGCPEVARQRDASLTATERAASQWCYCQHETAGQSHYGPLPDGDAAVNRGSAFRRAHRRRLGSAVPGFTWRDSRAFAQVSGLISTRLSNVPGAGNMA